MNDSYCPDCGGYLYWHASDCPSAADVRHVLEGIIRKYRERVAALEKENEDLRNYRDCCDCVNHIERIARLKILLTATIGYVEQCGAFGLANEIRNVFAELTAYDL